MITLYSESIYQWVYVIFGTGTVFFVCYENGSLQKQVSLIRTLTKTCHPDFTSIKLFMMLISASCDPFLIVSSDYANE